MSLWFRIAVYPFLWFISILPFPILYVLSDFIAFLLYRVLKYRVQIVRSNLKNSFPQKSEEELLTIEKGYYYYLADLMLETIKGMTISEKSIKKHMQLINADVMEELNNQHKSSVVIMSHCGNWEWVCVWAQLAIPQHAQSVYKTLSNKNWDAWFLYVRSRFGTQPFPMEKTLRVLTDNANMVTCTAFIGDQNPASPKNAYWSTFLNQETCFMTGSEKIARKMDYPVYYLQVKKVKRGYYQCELKLLCQYPKNTFDGDITEMLVRATEADIQSQPETWLWSHRRWKHKKD
jgi:KDO2-lipid IV(A) lauroyltransferase